MPSPLRSPILPLLLASALAFGSEPAPRPVDPAIQRLGQALTFRTVSGGDLQEFARFHQFLRTAFPRVHRLLECRELGRASLLYRWRGSRPELRPIILLAHQDVVPVDEATLGKWRQGPFSGAVAGGFLWGRGARDFKPGLMAILESAETLLQQGFVPERDVYFAFGDDEEIQGYGGAGILAGHLARAGVKAEFILDEGGGVVKGAVSGIAPDRPVALVGVAEKGYLGLELTVGGLGGHSASALRGNPILILGEALRKIEAEPFPAVLQEPLPSMFASLAQGMGFPRRFAFTHLWLTGGILKRVLLEDPETEAMLRTTVAVTRFESGVGDNVVPGRAMALLNIRLLPGWTPAQVQGRIATLIGDPRVVITVKGRASEAPPLAPVDTPGYRALASAIHTTFPGALVAPSLAGGTTDIRHYAALSANLYRFAPSVSTRAFSGNGHGVDERLPLENYGQYLSFYTTLLRTGTTALPLGNKP